MKKIIINGRFLSQRITGVQRYALEIVKELDKIIRPETVEIAVPVNAENIPPLKNITIERVGKTHGHLWEQMSFVLYALKKKGLPLNMCSSAPLLYPGIVCLHDARLKRFPKSFSTKFRLWYGLLAWNTAKRAKKIITVSNFSKKELCELYHIDPDRIEVIPCAWQHFERVGFDEGALAKYGLEKGEYYFSMSSIEPNKNFRWIAEAAERNKRDTFAVSGSVNNNVFPDGWHFECPENVKLLGYASDEEAKTLMRDCKAFLFPTIYEGFGIPPMEAMSAGARAIVSDASCMREIYGNCVSYVDPSDSNANLEKLLEVPVENASEVLDRFSWEKSAAKFNELIRVISNE